MSNPYVHEMYTNRGQTESVEEIVARQEQRMEADAYWAMPPNDLLVLIASWRERGEALKPFANAAGAGVDWGREHERAFNQIFREDLIRARAALKAKPEGGA